MTELVMLFLAGTGGAALIKLLDNVIQFSLQRRAKRKDIGQKEKTELEKQVDAIQQCLMVSMLDRIQYLCRCYIRDKSISIEDRRRLHQMHKGYKAVGGNGALDDFLAQVDELTLKFDRGRSGGQCCK